MPVSIPGTNFRPDAPLISVVMPVWNGSKHLREAIDSILAQTEGNFEFLIIDDGSTDDTISIIESYCDERITLIRQEHEGIVVALNRGVAEAKAGLIARMDADDIAYPSRFRQQLELLRKNPSAVLCHTQIRIIGEERYVTRAGRFVRGESLTLLRMCHQCPIVHPTVMFRKAAFLASGGYLPEERHAEDFGLWGRMIRQGGVVGISRPLLCFRVHQGSISKLKAEDQMALSVRIALSHCRQFMSLSEPEALRAMSALKYAHYSSKLRDWFWLMFHCLPRLRTHDVELWGWALHRTAVRLLRAARLRRL